ncbi:Plasmodium exported protein (Pm-fam-a like), unknown function [Plasmodium malariae]|nr:Plasmodium exported protein (Pm-fam-a like), unknown function [Plasmodium malariae]
MPNFGECKKKNIFTNKKGAVRKNKHPYESSLNNRGDYEQARKGKSPAFTGGNKYFDKGVSKKKHYLKNVRMVANADIKFLRKIKRRKGDNHFVLIILYLLSIVITSTITFFRKSWIPDETLYGAILVSLCVFQCIVLVGHFYMLRKIAKYKKLIHIKSDMHNTAYPSISKVIFYND